MQDDVRVDDDHPIEFEALDSFRAEDRDLAAVQLVHVIGGAQIMLGKCC